MDRYHPHDLVAWIDGAKAPTEECQVIFDIVVGCKLTRFEAVAETVAAELLTRDGRRAGGDVAAMEQLRAWYIVAARRLLHTQNGISIRITPAVAASASPHSKSPGVTRLTWRRPVGLYAALGGFLAAFQHFVQRYIFQGRPVDLSSGLVLAAYVGVGVLGLRWFLDPRGPTLHLDEPTPGGYRTPMGPTFRSPSSRSGPPRRFRSGSRSPPSSIDSARPSQRWWAR